MITVIQPRAALSTTIVDRASVISVTTVVPMGGVAQSNQNRIQTGLDAEATAADRVQTGLDAEATAADRVQTGLDAEATAADRVQTGLDAEATAADRVQTGLDAAAALGSANSASQSYQSILSLGTFNFDGGRADSVYGGSTSWNAGGAA